MLEDHDFADAMDGGDAVGDDEGGAAAHELFDRFHDRGLGGGIEGAGGEGHGAIDASGARGFIPKGELTGSAVVALLR